MDGSVGDGQSLRLHEGAGLGGDGIELRLKRIGHDLSLSDEGGSVSDREDFVFAWEKVGSPMVGCADERFWRTAAISTAWSDGCGDRSGVGPDSDWLEEQASALGEADRR